MDTLTKAGLLRFIAFQINKGLVNGNTGGARKAACVKILEAFGDDEALDSVDVRSEVLKFNNRHPGQLSPDSLNTYEKRVAASLEEFKKYLANPTGYKGVAGRSPATGAARERKAKPEPAVSDTGTAMVEAGVAAPHRVATSAVTDTSLMLPFPLRPAFLAQLIVPRDMTKDEAARLCAFIQALAVDTPVAPQA